MNGHNGTELRTLQEKFANPPDREPFEPSMLPTVDEVLETAASDMARARQVPGHRNLSFNVIAESVRNALQEISTLETAARNPDKWNASKDLATSIAVIVRFSSPGDYYRPEKPPERPDRFTGKSWAMNMDRWADDIAARFGISIAGIRTGIDLSMFARDELLVDDDTPLHRKRNEARDAITRSGVKFLYSGRPDETEAVRRVIHTPSSFVPPQSVEFENRKLDNTLDQVRLFGSWLESKTFASGSRVVLVGFAPHLMRTTRMFGQHQTIPDTVKLSLFPIATPQIKMSEHPLWEVRGTVCYYGITGDASLTPCPYEMFGSTLSTHSND